MFQNLIFISIVISIVLNQEEEAGDKFVMTYFSQENCDTNGTTDRWTYPLMNEINSRIPSYSGDIYALKIDNCFRLVRIHLDMGGKQWSGIALLKKCYPPVFCLSHESAKSCMFDFEFTGDVSYETEITKRCFDSIIGWGAIVGGGIIICCLIFFCYGATLFLTRKLGIDCKNLIKE